MMSFNSLPLRRGGKRGHVTDGLLGMDPHIRFESGQGQGTNFK